MYSQIEHKSWKGFLLTGDCLGKIACIRLYFDISPIELTTVA